MAYRFDMRNKTPQQQAIVRARDSKTQVDEINQSDLIEKTQKGNGTEPHFLAIDMDICPLRDCVIYQDLCGGCEFYRKFEIIDGQRCIKCGF